MMAMIERVPVEKPRCASRKCGYRSCVPWLKKLKQVISATAYSASGQWPDSAVHRLRLTGAARVATQVADSGTLLRMYSTSSAGAAPTMNMPRQPICSNSSPKTMEANR